MRPAVAYRLKYRSSSQNSMETETKTSDAVLGFVFGLPNGVAWNVLSFWQCYYRIRTPNSSGLGGPDDTHWRTGPW